MLNVRAIPSLKYTIIRNFSMTIYLPKCNSCVKIGWSFGTSNMLAKFRYNQFATLFESIQITVDLLFSIFISATFSKVLRRYRGHAFCCQFKL